MPKSGKRNLEAVETVDLTDDNENPSKLARTSSQGTSSQPRASQSLSGRDAWSALQDEENEVIDLTQEIDDSFGWLCIGALDGKIVGIRYYDGYATMGEQVLVVREPENAYDSNAIQVNNVHGTQIGHLPRQLAEKLAPLMDDRALIIEGTIAGEKGSFDCPILLKCFGPAHPASAAQLETQMKARGLKLKKRGVAAAKQPKKNIPLPSSQPQGFSSQPSSSQAAQLPELSIQDFVAQSERFNPRDVQEIADQWGFGEDALFKMPMAKQPDALQSTLLPYQLQGLAWLLEKENPVLPEKGSKDVVQLWKRSVERPNAFTNIATNHTTDRPKVAKGGILADDMGLGKTLQVISVILEGGPGPTLILAPVSVMSNWAQQIERHVKKSHALKVMTYHGGTRKKMTQKDFAEYDVVISTYGTVASEYMPRGAKAAAAIPRKDGLFSMRWSRVVLDEGHGIRNHKTKNAISSTALLADRRWILTGTPIVNSIKDFYSMIKFLGITGGLEHLELFNTVLTRPLSQGNPAAELLLQTVMRSVCLRRKKDMKFIDLKLPELSEYVHRIAFRKDEKKKYEALQIEAKGMVRQFQESRGRDGIQAYRHLLEILLRLRQTCCHWKLTGSRVTDLLALLGTDEVVELNEENRAALQALLQLSIESREECSICLEELHNPVITACKHVFGGECIERTIELQHKCPMCRATLQDKECLVQPAQEETFEEEIDVDIKSSKTEALMSILQASHRDPDSKVVIFSQWTSFLNIIQHQLEEAGMKFARIDGTMNAHTRDAGMAALESDPDTKIVLASLSVCSVGLNLVAADTVILADSWWAPAIEDQAVDRVHRLGQTRPCTVWRLIMEDSIEERVLDIQAEKRKLVGKAFRETSKGGKEKNTRGMADIMKLLA